MCSLTTCSLKSLFLCIVFFIAYSISQKILFAISISVFLSSFSQSTVSSNLDALIFYKLNKKCSLHFILCNSLSSIRSDFYKTLYCFKFDWTQKSRNPKLKWHVTHDMWHMTCGTWHVAHDMWRVTCDSWQMTCDRQWNKTNSKIMGYNAFQ